jgi:hypothetical protein
MKFRELMADVRRFRVDANRITVVIDNDVVSFSGGADGIEDFDVDEAGDPRELLAAALAELRFTDVEHA